ncbi:DUF2218 domain-containing protein [Spongiactinospora sp. TRM90649]|uniref:DUF2218 domain-containing protein n=1 Tax=Spongiactinospora sp. TRM90649 TaxID=3031114 RepID=UPI0023F9445F|nr:DUF2218 domain-containing protein [Spongiactinospora sp. TRM90649]MDF5753283.1 DUF2218 domain-containing protein [Spongiactinospora sp. TRM90649]
MESTANVTTDRPERYLKQLCSHLGRKIQADHTETEGLLTFAYGQCELTAHPGSLALRAAAPTPDDLDKVEDVVARHLARFGDRDELTVTWTRSTD